jgi:hypothetical protein
MGWKGDRDGASVDVDSRDDALYGSGAQHYRYVVDNDFACVIPGSSKIDIKSSV